MQIVQTNKRILFSNVLFATDLSHLSKIPLEYAVALARQYGAKVFVAHAVEPESHFSSPLETQPENRDPLRLDAEWHLADLVRQVSVGNISHEEFVERGEVWDVLHSIIQKRNVDLIVAGTHGRQGAHKVLIGSKAENLYRRANCPVLTIGPHVPPPETEGWRIKRILFPTDGSESSLSALPYALSLAEENQATLIFLQLVPLMPLPEFREADEASTREALRSLVPAEADAWCKPEFVARFGFPAEGILRLAAERAVDFFVMGVKKSSFDNAIASHLPWAIASEVVGNARCPVLTVRG